MCIIKFMNSFLYLHNPCLQVQRFAEALACHALVAACQKFVQKFFAHVAEGAEFLSLDVDHVRSLKMN